MTPEADQAILEYLAEVTRLAQGQMTPQNRNTLISRLRADIEQRASSRNATKAADVRQILLGMGTPQAHVMVEANKDPLFAARQRERDRLRSGGGYGGGSVFSPEVDPAVAGMVTPETLTNPPPDRGASGSYGPGPEIPLEPDPFNAGAGEWGAEDTEGPSGGPQVPLELPAASGGGGSRSFASGTPGSGPWARAVGERVVRSNTQAVAGIIVLFVGAVANTVAMSPYTIAIVLVGYLIAMTSYSFTAPEKRFAMVGVPLAALLFYAFGLFLARGRSTGHDTPLSQSDTWQAAKDGFTAVPTMLGLLGALYLLWRLFRSAAKSG